MVAVALLGIGPAAHATDQVPGSPLAVPLAALGGADLVVIEETGLVTVVRASAATPVALRAVLLDPQAWRQALPSLARADVLTAARQHTWRSKAYFAEKWHRDVFAFRKTASHIDEVRRYHRHLRELFKHPRNARPK